MAALDYAGLVDGVVTILRADSRLEDVHCSEEPEDPVMEQCPAVLVGLTGFVREPYHLVAMLSAGAPYKEIVRLELACWAFAAESAGDARRRLAALVTLVEGVCVDNVTLGQRVSGSNILRGDFLTRRGQGGIFASAILHLDCLALT